MTLFLKEIDIIFLFTAILSKWLYFFFLDKFIFIIFTISSLSFLGIGIQPPSADWASMVRENAILIQYAQYDITAGLTPLIPAAAIALLCVSINFVVDWYLYITSGLKDDVK